MGGSVKQSDQQLPIRVEQNQFIQEDFDKSYDNRTPTPDQSFRQALSEMKINKVNKQGKKLRYQDIHAQQRE